MKNCISTKPFLAGIIAILVLFSLQTSKAQLLGGIEDKTFNMADSGGSVVPLNQKNQVFYPAPNAGLYVSMYTNWMWADYPGRHLQEYTSHYDKDGVSRFNSIYGYYSARAGIVLEASPRNYFSLRNWIKDYRVFGGDSLIVTRIDPSISSQNTNPNLDPNKALIFPRPLRGFYETGIGQTASNRLALWLTYSSFDSLKVHNSTWVKLLDTSCAPLPVQYQIQNFRALKSAVFQGNIYLLGYNMIDTLEAGTRMVILNGATLEPISLQVSGLNTGLIDGKLQIFSILPDGKMLVAGTLFNGNFTGNQAIRLNADGSFDSSFGLSLFSGLTGVRWQIDLAGTLRCASTKMQSGSGLVMASLGVVQPNGGIVIADFPIPQEAGICQPLMYHPDYDAFLFETGNRKPLQISPRYLSSYFSDTLNATRHRFYVKYNGQTWPLINRSGYGFFGETMYIDVNPVANKFVTYGQFTQINRKHMHNLALSNADGTLVSSFTSVAELQNDSLKKHLSAGIHQAKVTNSGKVLVSFPASYSYDFNVLYRPIHDTIFRLENGQKDQNYNPVWHHGTLTRMTNGGYMSIRLYDNGQPASYPMLGHSTVVKVIRLDAEGNFVSETPGYSSDGQYPDTMATANARLRDIFCDDNSGAVWTMHQFQIPTSVYYTRSYYVRHDVNGSTRIINPNFTCKSKPLKIEILPGKRMRWTGAFGLKDSTLFGKVVNVIETDSTGILDPNVAPRSFYVPNAYGGRSKMYASPTLTQGDGKMVTQLKALNSDLALIYYRLLPNGNPDPTFMPFKGIFGVEGQSTHGLLGDRLLLGVTNYNWAGYQYSPRISLFGTSFKNGVLGLRLNVGNPNSGYVQGRVTQVVSPAASCNPGVVQRAASGMIIRSDVTGRIALTDTGGYYSMVLDTGLHTVNQTTTNNNLQRQVCPVPPTTGHTFHLAAPGNVAAGKNFINQTYDCPRLDLSVLEPRFRLCSKSSLLLQYQNDGVADQPNARIRLNLPEEIRILSASRPFTKESDSSYVFDLGNLPAGHFGRITIVDTISCPSQPDSLARACFSARIEPLSLCTNINPGSIQWDGAWLDAVARYVPALNKVRVVVYNRGASMADSTPIALTGTGTIYRQGKIKLTSGDSLVTFCEPAIIGSIQLQLQQPQYCPLGSNSTLFHSGRGTARAFLNFGSGLLETYTVQSCPVFRFSYDPNEKLVQPIGDVEPGTELDYTIHFENYGNDTAYAVTVEDTLPAGLDLNTLKIGMSSHPMTIEVAGTEANPILYFHFRDIKLTGKKQDSVRSKGQLSFKIRTQPNVERGTLLHNRAHIYFDRNEAVITEFVTTKIAELGVVTSRASAKPGAGDMVLAPNPSEGSCKVLFGNQSEHRTIHISSITGQHINSIDVYPGQDPEIRGLRPGVYIVSCHGYKPQQLIVVK